MLSVEAIDLYYGASHALRRVSLTAKKGEVTCILGRNGVGKTSLLRAIFGLHPIRSGRIRWEDKTISDLPPHERARSGGQQQQLAIARALVQRPRLLILDEPTEGIQPSIIKDIGRVIQSLVARGDMAILLVEQYFEFARDLAAAYVVMQRGEIVLSGRQSDMDEAAARAYLTV